ncbi:MAG: response regulator transcription factor [Candidatus Coatesbacteria bacterium]|nr:MAG: response regulator transcription factor [Candidatus Coatesbacteria bacterium]
MTAEKNTVFVVDDDPSVRGGLNRLFKSVGLAVETFASAAEFLERGRGEGPACLVLDVRMPELSGLDLQAELARADVAIPIVFITGHGSVPMSVRAMKAGAADFLEKPVDEQELLDAVNRALARDRRARREQAELADLRRRLASLTSREREVLSYVAAGRLNKQIAAELGTSEKTVKVHRARVMEKMEVASVAELARLAEKLDLSLPEA